MSEQKDDQYQTTRRPHPADGMVAHVECGGGARMCIPDPSSEQSLSWSLTWASNVEPFRLSAASVIGSYNYLLSGEITMTEAIRRLQRLRAKWEKRAHAG